MSNGAKLILLAAVLIMAAKFDYQNQMSHAATEPKTSTVSTNVHPIESPQFLASVMSPIIQISTSALGGISPDPAPNRTPTPEFVVQKTFNVMATAYGPVDTPGKITKCGPAVEVGMIAVSHDLDDIIPCGTKVRIIGLGPEFKKLLGTDTFTREDLTAESVPDHTIDIRMTHYAKELKWGRRPVQIEILGPY